VDAGPEALGNLPSRDKLAWPFQQQFEKLKRLLLEFQSQTALAQLALLKVHFEYTEPDDAHGGKTPDRGHHTGSLDLRRSENTLQQKRLELNKEITSC
jgi:hypothetical protein